MAAPRIQIVRDVRDDAQQAQPPRPTPPAAAHTTATAIERYQHGWRSGKPVEDPEKLKRWGFVGAKPSEFLVVTRRGHIDRARSGQGARIFKWPWDSIAIVPTTLQRIELVADQVTRERVGVQVSGIAVYRIAEPLLAFRVLNFTFAEAAAEKLAETLREMFVGAARRLIANLSLEECLTRRKEAIAGYLMQEIAPVVGGEGAPGDTTSKGWGVVIDTIEIQDVRIQSQQVFAHLQAPYRAEIAARAELAELERARQVADMQAAAERRSAELERDRVLRQIAIAEEQRRAKAAADVASLEAERVRAAAAQTSALLDAEHKHALAAREQEAEAERARKHSELTAELRGREAAARDLEGELEATQQRRLAELELLVARDRRLGALVTQALPEIARALQTQCGDISYTQIGGDGNGGPLDAVPRALAQLMALAKSFGLELP